MDSDIFKIVFIKIIFPKSKSCCFKFANEKDKLKIAICVVAKFQQYTGRSSRSYMFFKIGVLKNVHRKIPVLESLF